MANVDMTGHKIYQDEIAKLEASDNRNGYIQLVSECLKSGSCPITLRKMAEAQHSYEGLDIQQPDGQSIRIKILNASSVGLVACLATRVFRTAWRTVFSVLSVPHSLGKAARYNLEGETVEDLKRIGHEWLDLGTTVLLIPIGLVKLIRPDALSGAIKGLADYYIQRIDDRTKRDAYVETMIKIDAERRKVVKKAWEEGAALDPIARGDENPEEGAPNETDLLISEK